MHPKTRMITALICVVLVLSLSACGADKTQEAVDSQILQNEPSGDASVVYFTSDISAEGLVRLYDRLEWKPSGDVAVKISTGEPPDSNYLRPELIGDLVQMLYGRTVDLRVLS